jgi:hypothetical protein
MPPSPLSTNHNAETTPKGKQVNMATDNLLGATVRIRRGWHGGRTGEVVAFDHQAGPPSSYTVIKVQLKGSAQPVMIYSLDEIERLHDRPSVSEFPTTPAELSEAI